MSQYVTLELKRGTAAEWISRNPILAQGELGFESDTGKLKIGDGITAWISLAYVSALTTADGSINLGQNAGLTGQGIHSVAIGYIAGSDRQGNTAVAIGDAAGSSRQGNTAVAIGDGAGGTRQGQGAAAVGSGSGSSQQGNYAVAVGFDAGWSGQGDSSIAIGSGAGYLNQPRNSIILNASGSTLNAGQTGAFYVRPIRQDITKRIPLSYDPTTYEIIQGETYTWLQPATSFTSIFTTTGGVATPQINDSPIGSLDDAKYYLELVPLDQVFPTIFTPKNKSLSTIIEKNGVTVYGGTTLFIDINNYITVSRHPTATIPTIRLIVVSSSTPEKFSLNLRKINY